MKYLLSKELAQRIHADTASRSAELIERDIDPQLAVILVGDHPASLRYIALKSKAAKDVGIILSLYHLEKDATKEDIESVIDFLNADEEMHGIIMQLPLPKRFSAADTEAFLQRISPAKDVDGLRGDWKDQPVPDPTVAGLLAHKPGSLPPMVNAVFSLLDVHGIDPRDKQVAVIGEGRLVGGPLKAYLERIHVPVDSLTEDSDGILERVQAADLVISGTGQNEMITYQWIKEGAVVVDCDRDIHEDSVIQVASALAPSKGGVGPLTVAWLLHNTVVAAEQA